MADSRFMMKNISGTDYPEVEPGFEWINHALWDSAPVQKRPFVLFQKVQTNPAWGNLLYPGHMCDVHLFLAERVAIHSPELKVSGCFMFTIGNKNWTGSFFEVGPALWTAFPLPIVLAIGPMQHFKVELQLLTVKQSKRQLKRRADIADPRLTVTLWGRMKRPIS